MAGTINKARRGSTLPHSRLEAQRRGERCCFPHPPASTEKRSHHFPCDLCHEIVCFASSNYFSETQSEPLSLAAGFLSFWKERKGPGGDPRCCTRVCCGSARRVPPPAARRRGRCSGLWLRRGRQRDLAARAGTTETSNAPAPPQSPGTPGTRGRAGGAKQGPLRRQPNAEAQRRGCAPAPPPPGIALLFCPLHSSL